MQELSNKFYEVLQTHLDTGIPVTDLDLSDSNRKRIIVCMDVYKQLEDYPNMDITRYLRNRYRRTTTEILYDKKVINFLVAQLNTDTKELSRYRIKRAAEKVMQIGEQAGDWKPLIEGSKMLHKAEGLDKPESIMEDLEKSIHALPPVFTTDVTKINSDLTNFTDEQREKLMRKYHVQKDKTQEMVEAKMGLFVPAGSTLEVSEIEVVEEDDEPTMFDEFDEDDNGL